MSRRNCKAHPLTVLISRKTQQDEPTLGATNFEDELNGNYRKIHKTLGANNKNKDIRNLVKGELDERIENQLTTGMNLTINPVTITLILLLQRFQLGLEKDMQSTFKEDFKGLVE